MNGRNSETRTRDSYDQGVRLDVEQGRLIGSLVEKQLTTPQQYPLSLNSLVTACNQTSNRDPVVRYDHGTVQRALASLKEAGLVRFVYPSHGGSATRYRQVLDEQLGLDKTALALIAVLLLRGPQTAGELRARTERMTSLDGVAAVNAELERMGTRAEPLVLRLPRRPGLLGLVAPLDGDEPDGVGLASWEMEHAFAAKGVLLAANPQDAAARHHVQYFRSAAVIGVLATRRRGRTPVG